MSRSVTHLITGLGKGGAETMLYQLLKYRTNPEISHQVVSLGGAHYYEEFIRALGIPVTELSFRAHPVSGFLRLVKLFRGSDTLCCWMYHANFLGYPAAKAARVPKIIWCIRHSNLEPALNKKRTLFLNRICAHWSSAIDAIAYNGERSKQVHETIGYAPEKGCVLPNGCDTTEYTPDCNARKKLCEELGLHGKEKLLLSITKDTPIKDVPTFLQAIGLLCQKQPNITAILCGYGLESSNQRLSILCTQNGLSIGKQIFFLGMRHDVPALLAACDLYILHSAGEAFPNVLVQAMSCGCLCIATDVGDTRQILADNECIVPVGSAITLAEKINEFLSLPEEVIQLKRRYNRKNAQERFDIRKVLQEYEALF